MGIGRGLMRKDQFEAELGGNVAILEI